MRMLVLLGLCFAFMPASANDAPPMIELVQPKLTAKGAKACDDATGIGAEWGRMRPKGVKNVEFPLWRYKDATTGQWCATQMPNINKCWYVVDASTYEAYWVVLVDVQLSNQPNVPFVDTWTTASGTEYMANHAHTFADGFPWMPYFNPYWADTGNPAHGYMIITQYDLEMVP